MPAVHWSSPTGELGVSQQINLLLPELRPKHDWLAFPMVAGAAVAGVVLVAGFSAWGEYQTRALMAIQGQSEAEARSLQQQVQALGQTLAGRKPSATLQVEIDHLKDLLQQRDAALSVVESGKLNPGEGYASVMRGFARQVTEGVWLTGFSFSGGDAEIRGRLSDPAMLPQYIRRLNGEGAFQGRRFAALDMKEGSAAAISSVGAGLPGTANVPRYTEFALHGNLAGSGDRKQ